MRNHYDSPQAINPDAMYRARECARYFAVGLSTWWGWSKTGKIDRGIRLGPKITVWEGSYLLKLKQKLISESQSMEN